MDWVNMKIYRLHNWDVEPIEAKLIQNRLRRRIILDDDIGELKTIAGVHSYHDIKSGVVQTAIVVQTYPDLQTLETRISRASTSFPYVPGLLAFREGISTELAIEQLGIKPDIFLFSGHGQAHPRRFGFASHMGVILETPSIGCAKSKLWGKYEEPSYERGAFSYLYDGEETIGIVYRSLQGNEPIFISAGHKISLMTSLKIVATVCRSSLPEPIRVAYNLSSSF